MLLVLSSVISFVHFQKHCLGKTNLITDAGTLPFKAQSTGPHKQRMIAFDSPGNKKVAMSKGYYCISSWLAMSYKQNLFVHNDIEHFISDNGGIN